MVYIFRCSCLNICLHLADTPAEIKNVKDYEWFIQKTRWPSIGRADLAMGGVKLVATFAS